MGQIPGEYLPPTSLWPQRVYTLPEYQTYPQRLNSTEELLDKQVAAGKGDRAAILFEDKRIPYKAVLATVNRLGAALRRLGIAESDRVLLRLPNIPPAVMANFAIIKIGGVSVPTSALFSRAEIAHVANLAEAKAAIVAGPLLEEYEQARPTLATVQHTIVVGGTPEQQSAWKAKGYRLWQEVVDSERPECDPVRRDRMDVSVLLFTSGTTGLPKGTAHFMEEALIIPDGFGKYCWNVQEADVIGGSAPLAMAAGYSAVAVIPYRFGAAVSLLARFTPEAMFETIQNHKVTILSILPTAYRKMLQVPDAATKYDLRSLRMCTGGGESLTAQTYHDWKSKFNLEIYEGLGTTEMMFVFISSAATKRVKPGSIGPAIPGYRLKVISPDTKQECRGAETGMLMVQGPTGTVYWRDLDKQRSVVVDGWVKAGDMVSMDEDGYIWFLSREDDLIKSSGYRIGPEEIEDVLVTHPAVSDAGVVGTPDPIMGQRTVAYVALRPGVAASEALKQEIVDFCRGKVAVYKLPREIVVVPEMPRTITGKLLRRVLRDRATGAAKT
jgi:2-aminobenzoate-CoA ligase